MGAAEATTDGVYDPLVRPGWATIVEFATYLTGEARRLDEDKRDFWAARVQAGRLQFEVADPPESTAGLLAAAQALSAETCEMCGGKGDLVGDARLRPGGCRCERCRGSQSVCLARNWPEPSGKRDRRVGSPGQWTQDIRSRTGGPDWDTYDWRNYGRLENHYGREIVLLMEAMDDEYAMRLWAGGAGWAGLIRALFLTLRVEQDERPGDPDHVPWRLRWMKEKYGELDGRTTRSTPFQMGAVFFIEAMSPFVCLRCGAPGEIREARWIRPECDACWAKADEKSRASEREWRESWDPPGESPPDGFRGSRISW